MRVLWVRKRCECWTTHIAVFAMAFLSHVNPNVWLTFNIENPFDLETNFLCNTEMDVETKSVTQWNFFGIFQSIPQRFVASEWNELIGFRSVNLESKHESLCLFCFDSREFRVKFKWTFQKDRPFFNQKTVGFDFHSGFSLHKNRYFEASLLSLVQRWAKNSSSVFFLVSISRIKNNNFWTWNFYLWLWLTF